MRACVRPNNHSSSTSASWLTSLNHPTVTGSLRGGYSTSSSPHPPSLPPPSISPPVIFPETLILCLRSSTKRLYTTYTARVPCHLSGMRGNPPRRCVLICSGPPHEKRTSTVSSDLIPGGKKCVFFLFLWQRGQPWRSCSCASNHSLTLTRERFDFPLKSPSNLFKSFCFYNNGTCSTLTAVTSKLVFPITWNILYTFSLHSPNRT